MNRILQLSRREFFSQTATGLCFLGSVGRVTAEGGTTYFVNSAAGKDTNGGRSEADPWKTLKRVNSHDFSPGDRILLAAGTKYTGQLRLKSSGREVNGKSVPIVVDSYGQGPKPLLDAEGRFSSTIYLYNVQYITIKNLEVLNHGSERVPRRAGVFIHLHDYGTAHNIQLLSLSIHDVNGSLVKREGAGCGILWRNEGRSRRSRFDGILIEGCHLRKCERNGIIGSGNTDRRNWFPSLNVVIRNNILEEIPGDGIVPIACDGALVEHNLMRDCTRLLPDSEAAAGIWPWGCDNTIIQFNEVSDHKAPWDAQGFDSDWNCRDTLIQYNFSHDNEGGFLLVCNNGGAGPNIAGNSGSIIRYNLSLNDGIRPHIPPRYLERKRWFSPIFHISGPVENTRIYNNLIYVPFRSDHRIDRTMVQMDNWGGPWPENTYFANNIIFVQNRTRYFWGESKNHLFQHNLYRGIHENAPKDSNGLRSDPLFVAEDVVLAGIDDHRGFICRRDSPCIGAATPIENPGEHDYFGYPIAEKGPRNIGLSERSL